MEHVVLEMEEGTLSAPEDSIQEFHQELCDEFETTKPTRRMLYYGMIKISMIEEGHNVSGEDVQIIYLVPDDHKLLQTLEDEYNHGKITGPITVTRLPLLEIARCSGDVDLYTYSAEDVDHCVDLVWQEFQDLQSTDNSNKTD